MRLIIPTALLLFSVSCLAATSSLVSTFKQSEDGQLYYVGPTEEVKDSIGKKFTLITDSSVTCGILSKANEKDGLEDLACKKNFKSSLVFKSNKKITSQLPMGIAIDGCPKQNVSRKTYQWGSKAAKKILKRYPSKKYTGGEINEFTVNTKKFIQFVGIYEKGRESKSAKTGAKHFSGKHLRDSRFFEKNTKKDIVHSKGVECCDSNKEPFCMDKKTAVRGCIRTPFDNKIDGVATSTDGETLPYSINYGREGLHLILYNIKMNKLKQVYHNPIYAVGGCE